MSFIVDQVDPRQFGGLKGYSVSHYLIELVTFILYNPDYNHPITVLACTIDFSKAFDRQNHNILIIKLSDMGVLGWLRKKKRFQPTELHAKFVDDLW